LIAAPADGGDAHMQMLPKLARALMKKEFKQALADATSEAEVVDIVSAEVALDAPPAQAPAAPEVAAAGAAAAAASPQPTASGAASGVTSSSAASEGPSSPAASAPAPTEQVASATSGSGTGGRRLKLIGVTSCPTGIAHTYMAAEALEGAAREAGHEILVETQGSAGSTPLSAEQIADADA